VDFSISFPIEIGLGYGNQYGSTRVASGILRGKDILKDNPRILPSGVELTVARDRIKANDILADEDFEVPSGILAEGDPEPVPIMRSARQMIDEADSDLQVGDLLKNCLPGG
jgi:hypothetical protein